MQKSQTPVQPQIIRIAVPDLSSGKNSSSGNPIVDYIYLNKLFEKEFEKDNVKVEWHFFKGAGPVINEALANKQLDYAFLGDLATIIGKANGVETTLLAATGRDSSVYLGVIPDHGYDSLDKLKGKRIAVWQGTAHQLSFNRFIQSYGFNEKDFKIINLDPAATNAALAAKQVDAGWGLFNILALQKKGAVDIPLSTKTQKNSRGTIASALVARSEYVQTHPETTQRFINVVLKSAYWASQEKNREELIQMMSKNASYPEDLYRLDLQGKDVKKISSPKLDQDYLDYLQLGVDTALEAKLIRQRFDVNQWLDRSYLDKGLKQLNYDHVW
ncbi:ABC transporter substrate-binding protein [Acinetobacter qingfengensis]|uniref:ABC transporter substrate-binding protein n=1 Tax=Acinetobacter qingfengensis TaxID=1262585 RepID=UPI001D0D0659|nr:ABC transporter substrate-binding protein [Acinetobacter qingfengensis]